jgi:hypothetical protein
MFSLQMALRENILREPDIELYGPVFDSTFNRKEYQENFPGRKGGRCVGLTTLPHS